MGVLPPSCSTSSRRKRPRPDAPHGAVCRSQSGGPRLVMMRTGSLVVDEREGCRPLVRLTPQEACAVLSFLQLPGVAELIEHQEAARQAQAWRDIEEDPEYAEGWDAP